MNFEEPTDIELNNLMMEVAKEAHDKAVIEKKRLSEIITNYIIIIQAQMKAR